MAYGQILAAVPFRDDLAKPFNLTRVAQIPEYYDSFHNFLGSKEWVAFRSRDVYHKRNYFFLELRGVESPLVQCTHGTSIFHVRDACPVLTPFAYDMVWFPKNQSDFVFPDGTSFLFEYDPLEVRSYDRGPNEDRQPTSVAAWIVRQGSTYWCRLFERNSSAKTGEFQCSRGYPFEFEEGQGVCAPPPVADQAGAADIEAERQFDLLTMTLGLLSDVAMARRQLRPLPDSPYWILSEMLTG